ncbi:MAG: hypothetical protein ACOYOO_08080 [Saprospiraceae bacterium]
MPPAAAQFYIEPTLDSLILRSKINKSSVGSVDYSARSAEKGFCRLRQQNILFRGCVKSLFTALRAKLSFDRHIIFEISLREISKMMCLSK